MASRVAIVQCKDYDRESVDRTVRHIFALLGGIERFVQKGQKVLLKPNMLSAKEPERGITTHPIFLETVVRQVQSAGGEVWIGDSPSGAIKGIQRYWENTGFAEVAKRTGAKLINFEAGGTVIRETPLRKFHLARSVVEADVIINLPKFKTHGFTLYTGAIKNLYGTIPGLQKAVLHKCYPHPESFSRMLVDVYSLIHADLHLMDGILGMGGNGPVTGDLIDVGLVLASVDGVALDAVASTIMGFKEGEIDAIRLASERGVGEACLDHITILGKPLAELKYEGFTLPSNYLIRLIPQFLLRWLGRLIWVHPKADLEKCTACGVCVRSCPVHAIQMVDGYPVTDYHVCINCLCCNESCPENAVIQEKSWLADKLG